MRKLLCLLGFSLFPLVSFGYFQQAVTVCNGTSNSIAVTDYKDADMHVVDPDLQNYAVEPGICKIITFPSEQLTDLSQTFYRTYTINATADSSLICKVATDLNLDLTTGQYHRNYNNTNRHRCETTVSYDSPPVVFGTEIDVY